MSCDYCTNPLYVGTKCKNCGREPAPVQPVWIQPDHLQKAQKAPFLCRVEPHKRDDFVPLHTTPPAAPVQPVDGTQVSRVWWDGEKLMAKPIPLKDFYQPVQEPVAWMHTSGHIQMFHPHWEQVVLDGYTREKGWTPLYTTPPAAQRQWVGLTDEEMYLNCPNWLSHEQCKTWMQQIEAKLKEKNTAAQPAVPDAIHHTDLSEHPQYIEGWNDCRAEMLKGMSNA